MKRYQIPDARYQKGASLIFPLCPLESTFVNFVVKNKDLTTKEHKVHKSFTKKNNLFSLSVDRRLWTVDLINN